MCRIKKEKISGEISSNKEINQNNNNKNASYPSLVWDKEDELIFKFDSDNSKLEMWDSLNKKISILV